MQNMYESCWSLYKDEIPEDQKRSLETCLELLTKPEFNLEVLCTENLPFIGFFCYWEFDTFVYIEHSAIKKEYREKGLGVKAIAEILQKFEKPVVLAVDMVDSRSTRRKAGFFERLGFFLNPYEYIQPPLDEGKGLHRKFLMSYPLALYQEDFKYVRDTLYGAVFSAPVPV